MHTKERGGSDQSQDSGLELQLGHRDTMHMKEKEKRIQALFDCFNAGDISLNEYLGAIKHLTGL